MIRLSRLADYGVVLTTQLARAPTVRTAPELAHATGLPQPTVAKILKQLAHEGVLMSHRGATGGYSLARPASALTVADIIAALDGPIALTQCMGTNEEHCGIQSLCPTHPNWRRINDAVTRALSEVTLAEMATPAAPLAAAAPAVPASTIAAE